MARYQADDEPRFYRPYVPKQVVISQRLFVAMCILSVIGVFAIFLVIVV